ncbi:hypothetical protein [Psychrobacillus sp. FJAT-21963]|uniref:hypothetical protein n=1 Tax=Psychrobacillus sp. FJAT-21963 TaxID=1712028 RepID=UPI000701D0E4|nr:hypothetical protein [Psychrobacillus sp. FJAT-21963]KQL35364.1 hypothetical protein AN959_10585 [Psychrobacillus sp. FJAT-21963]
MNSVWSRYKHWLFYSLVVIGLIISLTKFTYSVQAIIATVFGIVGILGVTYLTFQIETQKRKENKK